MLDLTPTDSLIKTCQSDIRSLRDQQIAHELGLKGPFQNLLDTQTAVLYQDRAEAGEFALGEPVQIAALLNRFFSHDESDEREFERAMAEFKTRIPDLAQSLRDHIAEAHRKNRDFRKAFDAFVSLCRASLKPEITGEKVDEMLIQHLPPSGSCATCSRTRSSAGAT